MHGDRRSAYSRERSADPRGSGDSTRFSFSISQAVLLGGFSGAFSSTTPSASPYAHTPTGVHIGAGPHTVPQCLRRCAADVRRALGGIRPEMDRTRLDH